MSSLSPKARMVAFDAQRILGLQTDSLEHPQWQEVEILNDIRHVCVWFGNEVIWSGLMGADRFLSLHDLQELHPSVEISESDVEPGIHY